MADYTSTSTKQNRSTISSNTALKNGIGLIIFFVFSIVNLNAQNKNILVYYYNNQKYSSSKSGRLLQKTQKTIVNSLKKYFDSTDEIIVITELCDQFELSGGVYNLKNGGKHFFLRHGETAKLKFDKEPYRGSLEFYQKILDLQRNDSLKYYEDANKLERDADDENCWLYVTHIINTKNGFRLEKYTFSHPIAFRRELNK